MTIYNISSKFHDGLDLVWFRELVTGSGTFGGKSEWDILGCNEYKHNLENYNVIEPECRCMACELMNTSLSSPIRCELCSGKVGRY